MNPDRPRTRTRTHTLLPLLLLLALSPWAPGAALAAQDRIALVIGNAEYAKAPLFNTIRDAARVAEALKALGFRVRRHDNLDRRAMNRVVRNFLADLKNNDATALIYYSGHGARAGGDNFLIPVDARVETEEDLYSEAFPLRTIIDGMNHRAAEAVNLVVVDACRDNPYRPRTKSGGSKGMERQHPPSGILIFYAAEPGDQAADDGRFARRLASDIERTGEPVEMVFKQVATHISQASHGGQNPWMEGTLRGPNFYFRPPMPLGHLLVASDTPGVEVSLNGRPVGRTGGQPLPLPNLPAGEARA